MSSYRAMAQNLLAWVMKEMGPERMTVCQVGTGRCHRGLSLERKEG